MQARQCGRQWCRLVWLCGWVAAVGVVHGHMFSWLMAPDYSHQLLDTAHRRAAGIADHNPHDPHPHHRSAQGGGAAGPQAMQFELALSDDQFLQQAAAVTGVVWSEQEKCQQKAILAVEKSCASLTEEEMSKVAVHLLNCQSAVEARPVFQCTPAMTIAECTRPMDAQTWNAYHIVANRARAVCYSARQQQFRAAAELAVNKLVAQTQRQMSSMASLEAGHGRLERLTADTMQAVAFGQKQLITQQETLQLAQKSIKSQVSGNLRELTRVRAALGVSETEVARQLRRLRRTLAATGLQLHQHSSAATAGRQLLAQQLHQLSQLAASLTDRLNSIDEATEAATSRLNQLAVSMQLMNSTMLGVLAAINSTQQHIGNKIVWLNQLLGGDLHRLLCVLYHAGFLALAMLVTVFVRSPNSVRLCLLLVVPANAVSALHGGPQLALHTDVVSLLLCVALAHYVVVWAWRRRVCRTRPSSATAVDDRQLQIKPTQHNTNGTILQANDEHMQRSLHCSSSANHRLHTPPPSTATASSVTPIAAGSWARATPSRHLPRVMETGSGDDHDGVCDGRAGGDYDGAGLSTPLNTALRHRHSSTSSHTSVTASGRTVCAAICRNGQNCRNGVVRGSVYCAIHSRVSREQTPA